MSKEKIFGFVFLIIFIVAVGCNSRDSVTGSTVATEPNIYEEINQSEQQIEEQIEAEANQTEEDEQKVETQINQVSGEFSETLPFEEQAEKKSEEFKFEPTSIVAAQHNTSISLDNLKHEIKSEYWGKITGITATVLNNGSRAFKPKLLVLLYDEKDFKDEWLKPKAEIEFGIEKLNFGEHITRDAIVNIAFDDIALTKRFKLVLVDAADPGNKPIVVAEKEFNPLLG